MHLAQHNYMAVAPLNSSVDCCICL